MNLGWWYIRISSIIEIDEVDGEKPMKILSTNGDTHLGGEDYG